MKSRALATEPQLRTVQESDVPAVINTYRTYILSLLKPILQKALITPSSLWIRAILLPLFAFYLAYQPNSIIPWVVGIATLALVPVVVAGVILLQLYLIVRKGTETELSDKISEIYNESGSRFFVVLGATGQLVGCAGVRSRTGGQAELTYFAVRPGIPDRAALADALLSAAIPHARRAGFEDLVVKLNSAETELLAAVKRAGFGQEQLSRINAWFHAHRLMLHLKKHR